MTARLSGEDTVIIHPTPTRHSEYFARRERDIEKGEYCVDWVKRREETRNRTFFIIEVTFDDDDGPIRAQRELAAAGFDFKIIEVDSAVGYVLTEVCRSFYAGLDEDALWKQVDEIVEPLGGCSDNGGLIEAPEQECRLHRLQ
jgi:hypothetical protein